MFKTLCLSLTLVAASSFAQAKPQQFDFEPEDDILGDTVGPDVELVTQRESVKHRSLITLRDEFKAKVLESFKEL